MRRFFVYLLLIVLPLQFSWAAASAYCSHESGSGAMHFGHHIHKHTENDTAEIKVFGKAAKLSHADCATCHFGCAAPCMQVMVAALEHASPVNFTEPLEHASHIPPLPDRPDRSRAA